MRRRAFITLLGGAAAWPLVARAQQAERMRRVGMLMTQAQDDPSGRARNKVFLEALEKLGWSNGNNVRIEYRWSAGDAERIRKDAADLAAVAPDVILTNGAAAVAPLLQATRTVPVVFVLVADPVGAGFVESLAHPGRNATGFSALEYGLGGKWLELLKEIAPGVTRAAIVRDPAISAGLGLFGAIQSAAASLGIEVTAVDVSDITQTDHALAAFARVPKGGVVVTASALALSRRDPLVALAAKHRLPAVYFSGVFVAAGGLAAYTPDNRNNTGERRATLTASSKARSLPTSLCRRRPNTSWSSTALGLTVPDTLLARADEVIE